MDDRRRKSWLAGAALLMLGGAVAELVLRPPGSHPPLPSSSIALAARLETHPTDWLAACALVGQALDSKDPNRFVLWHAAHAHALLLAPNRPEPQEAFARSGLFHWTELGASDRKEVLAAIEPLLRNPTTFSAMDRALFGLTGDLEMLRRAQPHTESSINELLSLAVTNGRFDDYRSLRAELGKKQLADFQARAQSATPRELIEALPAPPYRKDNEPLLAALLRELHERPLDGDPLRPEVIDGLLDYALRHDVGPLDGLEVIVRRPGSAAPPMRLRLAHKLGITEPSLDPVMARPPETAPASAANWQGLCGSQVCDRTWRDVGPGGELRLTLAPAAMDEVAPYAEVYLDDALIGEGEVRAPRQFVIAAGSGARRLEVRLANPLTRNLEHRQMRIVSAKPS